MVLAAVVWGGGGATNDWDDAANWDSDSVPTIQDDVTINLAKVAVRRSLLVQRWPGHRPRNDVDAMTRDEP
ncbi:MAG: hypothetical protein AAFN70_04955 [Planctomycetota bacterium]